MEQLQKKDEELQKIKTEVIVTARAQLKEMKVTITGVKEQHGIRFDQITKLLQEQRGDDESVGRGQ